MEWFLLGSHLPFTYPNLSAACPRKIILVCYHRVSYIHVNNASFLSSVRGYVVLSSTSMAGEGDIMVESTETTDRKSCIAFVA